MKLLEQKIEGSGNPLSVSGVMLFCAVAVHNYSLNVRNNATHISHAESQILNGLNASIRSGGWANKSNISDSFDNDFDGEMRKESSGMKRKKKTIYDYFTKKKKVDASACGSCGWANESNVSGSFDNDFDGEMRKESSGMKRKKKTIYDYFTKKKKVDRIVEVSSPPKKRKTLFRKYMGRRHANLGITAVMEAGGIHHEKILCVYKEPHGCEFNRRIKRTIVGLNIHMNRLCKDFYLRQSEPKPPLTINFEGNTGEITFEQCGSCVSYLSPRYADHHKKHLLTTEEPRWIDESMKLLIRRADREPLIRVLSGERMLEIAFGKGSFEKLKVDIMQSIINEKLKSSLIWPVDGIEKPPGSFRFYGIMSKKDKSEYTGSCVQKFCIRTLQHWNRNTGGKSVMENDDVMGGIVCYSNLPTEGNKAICEGLEYFLIKWMEKRGYEMTNIRRGGNAIV